MNTRNYQQLLDDISRATPTLQELADLSQEQVDILQKHGDYYKDMLYLAIGRRLALREAARKASANVQNSVDASR